MNIHTPAAMRPTPAVRDRILPPGAIFSARMNALIIAIHNTFMTPPTNNSSINAQQQPTQYVPCRMPRDSDPQGVHLNPP